MDLPFLVISYEWTHTIYRYLDWLLSLRLLLVLILVVVCANILLLLAIIIKWYISERNGILSVESQGIPQQCHTAWQTAHRRFTWREEPRRVVASAHVRSRRQGLYSVSWRWSLTEWNFPEWRLLQFHVQRWEWAHNWWDFKFWIWAFHSEGQGLGLPVRAVRVFCVAAAGP